MISSVAAENEVYEVVSPLGEPVVEMITMAPRLDTLEGKTIGVEWGFQRGREFSHHRENATGTISHR